MPRALTIAEVIDKNKISSDRVWVYAMKIFVVDSAGSPVEELNLVNNNEDLTIDGEVYTASSFSVEKKETGDSLGSIKVTAHDHTRFLQTRLQQYFGAVGFVVHISFALTDDGLPTASLNADLVEEYKIIMSSANDFMVSLELGADSPLNVLIPKRVQSQDRCSYRYKSIECGYVGAETSCDFTLDGANGCAFHSNSPRFGGYPGIKIR